MKKRIAILLFVVLLFTACSAEGTREQGEVVRPGDELVDETLAVEEVVGESETVEATSLLGSNDEKEVKEVVQVEEAPREAEEDVVEKPIVVEEAAVEEVQAEEVPKETEEVAVVEEVQVEKTPKEAGELAIVEEVPVEEVQSEDIPKESEDVTPVEEVAGEDVQVVDTSKETEEEKVKTNQEAEVVAIKAEEDEEVQEDITEEADPKLHVSISKLDKVLEYIVITNNGDYDVDISGWKILSVLGGQSYYFDNHILKAHTSVKVGDSAKNADVDYHWLEGRGVWNNRKHDPAELFNQLGELIWHYDD